MTFPSSPFPHQHGPAWSTCRDCNAPYCMECRQPGQRGAGIHLDHNARCGDCLIGRQPERWPHPATALVVTARFPILRAVPLWRQTWVEDASSNGVQLVAVDGYWQVSGRWFPPLRCGPNGFGDPRKKIYTSDFKLLRLYTVDNCANCVAALRAVELMVYSCAQTAAEDAWADEHRCYWRMTIDERCRRGVRFDACTCGANVSMTNWVIEAEEDVEHWAWQNERDNTTYTMEIDGNATVFHVGEPADESPTGLPFGTYRLTFA